MKTLLLLAITITALAAPPKSEEVLHAEAAGAPPNVVQRIVQLEKTINRLQAELDQRTAAVPAKIRFVDETTVSATLTGRDISGTITFRNVRIIKLKAQIPGIGAVRDGEIIELKVSTGGAPK